MKKKVCIAVLIGALAVSGCGFLDSGLMSKTSGFIPSQTQLSSIKNKSPQEVFTLLGAPSQKFKTRGGGEIWIYVKKQERSLKVFGVGKKSSSCKCVSVVFNRGEVVGTKGPYPCSCRLLSQLQPND